MGSEWLLALLAMLPGVASAASGGSLDAALGALTEREWLGIAVLSAFGGVASLLQRLDASQHAIVARAEGKPYNDKSIIRSAKSLFVAAHMAGAIFIGTTTYFLLAGQKTVEISGPALIALILAVAFGGAQAAERSAAAYFRIVRLLRESEPGEAKK